jgi:hypothetical protein
VGCLKDGGLPLQRQATSTFLHNGGRAATTAGGLHSDDRLHSNGGLHSLPDGGDLHSLLRAAASFFGRGGIY